MQINPYDIITWLILGALAGSFTGLVLKRKKAGFGFWANFGIGLAGAVIGGAIFDLLNLDFGLSKIAISAQDLLSAFIGALIFLTIIWSIRRRKKNGISEPTPPLDTSD